MDKRTGIIGGVIMTFMMAFLMSGILSLFALGPNAEWLTFWPRQFIIAWPIAFILTQFSLPVSMKLAAKITGASAKH